TPQRDRTTGQDQVDSRNERTISSKMTRLPANWLAGTDRVTEYDWPPTTIANQIPCRGAAFAGAQVYSSTAPSWPARRASVSPSCWKWGHPVPVWNRRAAC